MSQQWRVKRREEHEQYNGHWDRIMVHRDLGSNVLDLLYQG